MTGAKVTIVGAGRVGASAAYALQLGSTCRELVLVDVASDLARGEAMDLMHGRAIAGGPCIAAGDYDAARGSDLVIVTAGLRRRPDESRLELIERNVTLFRTIIRELKEAGAGDAVLLVVTNPVDVLTYLAAVELGWPRERTIGLGTALDTLRFRSLLGERLGLDPARIDALIIGEHGDSMVPLLSAARYEGRPLASAPGYSEQAVREAVEATRRAGAEVLRLKGGAGYAVGLAVREVSAAILNEAPAALPVSTVHDAGELAGVALSLPTRVGRRGVKEVVRPQMAEGEHRALIDSAEVLRKTIARVMASA
jgi:L-lactate dehydrogenase